MKDKPYILLVDDDPNISRLVQLYLEKEGFEVKCADRGDDALAQFRRTPPDLMLLDVMLPGMDGWQVLKAVRKTSSIPIIMLTAKDETFDKVLGLELGADDYITKPFDSKELVARVKAVLRRSQPKQAPSSLKLKGLTLDESQHTVTIDGERVVLTYKEYELLRLFLSHPGMAFSREQLLQTVWNTDYAVETRTVDMHIRTLRQKLGDYGRYIETIRGVGYRLENQYDKQNI